ncbi:MAG: DUF5069 domain-containing protein [Proteobacteria bacterium]|nr:MAG: DUF5069 domain-containing protein [Pseudomonadota bacterium]
MRALNNAYGCGRAANQFDHSSRLSCGRSGHALHITDVAGGVPNSQLRVPGDGGHPVGIGDPTKEVIGDLACLRYSPSSIDRMMCKASSSITPKGNFNDIMIPPALHIDLSIRPPRSPREALGGFVIAARMLDKARADILGASGEYNFYPCGLGSFFWKFTGLNHKAFHDFVANGADDAEVDAWIRGHATVTDPIAVVRWNNEMIGTRLCDLPPPVQQYLDTYIREFCKPESKVKFFFDVYDVEEGVL